MHKQAFTFKTEAVDENLGTFEGYASVFGNKDQGGDIVEPGAFAKTLEESKGAIKLVADHGTSLRDRLGVGVGEEDENGLFIKGHFNMAKQFAREVFSDVKQSLEFGVPMGMSFAYDIIDSAYDKATKTLHLKELKLYEATITQYPMNQMAGILDVKSILDMEPDKIDRLIAELSAHRAEQIGAPTEAALIADLKQFTTRIRATA